MQEKSQVLRFNPQKMSREYGSNIYITQGNLTNRIQFRTSVMYGGLFMDEYSIFHLFKHDLYINRKEPDDHPYRLAQACSNAFYPIVVLCDKKGQVYGLRNDLIKERWARLKPDIEREFVGDYAERYIKKTEQNLFNRSKITDVIYRDIFFQAFFSLIYGYRMEIELPIEEKLPFIAFDEALDSTAVQKLISMDEDTIHVRKQSTIADERLFNYADVLHTFSHEAVGKIIGECSVDYRLDNNFLIDSIQANYNLKKENGDPLLDIKMESYYLSEYPLENRVDTDTVNLGIQIQEEQAKAAKSNKKSLWERFQDYLNSPI